MTPDELDQARDDPMPTPADSEGPWALLRVRSHRASERLRRLVGDDLEWWFSFQDGGSFARVPERWVERALYIPGVTRARPKGEVSRCWKMA